MTYTVIENTKKLGACIKSIFHICAICIIVNIELSLKWNLDYYHYRLFTFGLHSNVRMEIH